MTLNDSQMLAVQSKAPVVIGIAGAGAGKTRVMTCKIKQLIDSGVNPENILAITFTKKAATELMERIQNDKVTACTIHSLCYKLLRRIEKCTIWDRTDMENAYKTVLESLNFEGDIKKFIQSVDYAVSDLTIVDRNIYPFFKAYHNYMRKCKAYDFTCLQFDTYMLLRDNEQFRNEVKNQFKYIFVDEYQDVSRIQHETVKLLQSEYLMVIGDPWQSIYGFRGGSPEFIEEWTYYNGSDTVLFDTNYRNTGEINYKAQELMGEQRVTKCMNTHHGKSVVPKRASDEFDEAYNIADIISTMTKDERANTAILYRTNACSRVLSTVFAKRKIPYVIWGGFHLLDRAFTKDVIAYLKMSINRHDDVAFLRIVNSPKRKIGKVKIADIKEHHPCYDYAVYKYRKELESLKAVMNKIEAEKSVYRKIFLIRDAYIQYNAEIDTEVFDILLDTAKAYKDVDEFLEYVSLSKEDQAKAGSVKLMTMHCSKGLEFDNVMLYNINNGLMPLKCNSEEEERRLMYVALTRAKNKVIVSHNDNKSPYVYLLENCA